MVESIYFLKPAWCGNHLAGLWPEAGLTARYQEPPPSAGLLFGDQRVMAILAALVGFCFLIRGFTNRQLVERVRGFLQSPYTSRQATYDLRRLRRKGLIAKIEGTQRYQLASLGRRVALLFTKSYCRVLAPGLSVLDRKRPMNPSSQLLQRAA
jgi:hypothetical protein